MAAMIAIVGILALVASIVGATALQSGEVYHAARQLPSISIVVLPPPTAGQHRGEYWREMSDTARQVLQTESANRVIIYDDRQ